MSVPSKQDHKQLGKDRLITQWKDKPTINGLLDSWLNEADKIEDILFQLLEERGIDVAEGVNLDIIGAIVGQPRELISAEGIDYFGFAPNIQAQSFGTLTNPSTGGRWRSVDEQTTGLRTLTDEEYRLYIKAKIFRDNSAPTPENIIQQIKSIFDVDFVILAEGVAFYQISVGRRLTTDEKFILRDAGILPKPAGVGVGYGSEFDSDNFFGFQGVPGAQGFGSVNNPSIGGEFANSIF